MTKRLFASDACPSSAPGKDAIDTRDLAQRRRLGSFFRMHREAAGHSLETVTEYLGLAHVGSLMAFEMAEGAIALEDLFSLTNFLNVPPEDVLGIIYDLSGEHEDV